MELVNSRNTTNNGNHALRDSLMSNNGNHALRDSLMSNNGNHALRDSLMSNNGNHALRDSLMSIRVAALNEHVNLVQPYYLREGTRQAEMLAFPFAAAREPAKLAKRVLSGFIEMMIYFLFSDSL